MHPAIPTKSDTNKYQNPVNLLIYRVLCFEEFPRNIKINQSFQVVRHQLWCQNLRKTSFIPNSMKALTSFGISFNVGSDCNNSCLYED